MTMNFPPEEHQSLRPLLSLKRHEQPPPGYFANFSGRVIAGIENESLRSRSAWRTWVEETFQFRPILACVGSVAVVLTTVFGYGLTGILDGDRTNGKSTHHFDNAAPFAQFASPAFGVMETSVPELARVAPRRIAGFRSAREPELPGFRVQGGTFGVELAGFQQTR
jgi:hypothetical protein